jgi:hypothetical protein
VCEGSEAIRCASVRSWRAARSIEAYVEASMLCRCKIVDLCDALALWPRRSISAFAAAYDCNCVSLKVELVDGLSARGDGDEPGGVGLCASAGATASVTAMAAAAGSSLFIVLLLYAPRATFTRLAPRIGFTIHS